MKKTKKKIIIWLIVVAALSILMLAGYEIAMDYASNKAMSLIVSNQIESMLESGEITYEEILEIAEEPAVEESPQPSEEKDIPPAAAPPAAEKSPEVKKSAVAKATDKINDDIPLSDKHEIMKLITSRLTADEIRRLAAMLSGGVTSEEIGEAAKIAYARFSGEELTRVKGFWHKYKAKLKRVQPEVSGKNNK